MSEWISVDDRLPEENEAVLCYSSSYCNFPYDHRQEIAVFKGVYTFWFNDEDETAGKWPLFEIIGGGASSGMTHNFTYWIPLPEPPEEPH